MKKNSTLLCVALVLATVQAIEEIPPPDSKDLCSQDEESERVLSRSFRAIGNDNVVKNQGDLSLLGTFSTDPWPASHLKTYTGPTKNIELLSGKKSAYFQTFGDHHWSLQWYMQDYRTSPGPVMDHNVVPVYLWGITGKNIHIALVGDSVDETQDDLDGNIDEKLAADLSVHGEMHMHDAFTNQGFGTKAAGVISMLANNSVCGVGVAFDSKVAGVKTDDSDSSLGEALVHKMGMFDIYSMPWGTKDDGESMVKLTPLVMSSFHRGVREGRRGRGSLYLVEVGDGKKKYLDNCAADSLVNNPWTIAVASANQRGKLTEYSERCPAIMATAYSSGDISEDEEVFATELNDFCEPDFGGTAAAASIATGILALTIQANPDLGYRDIVHLIALSSEVAPLANNRDTWRRNYAGFWHSSDFGFGLLNAKNLVRQATAGWTNVEVQHVCTQTINAPSPLGLSMGYPARISLMTQGCLSDGDHLNDVVFIEQMEVWTEIQYIYRGALSIKLISPLDKTTTLLEPRVYDQYTGGINKEWNFKSVANFGENPSGTWTVEVSVEIQKKGLFGFVTQYGNRLLFKNEKCGRFQEGCFNGFTLKMYGLGRPPPYQQYLPRTYSAFRLPDGTTNLN